MNIRKLATSTDDPLVQKAKYVGYVSRVSGFLQLSVLLAKVRASSNTAFSTFEISTISPLLIRSVITVDSRREEEQRWWL
ncbi:hypothetical protein BJV77DRAFT_981006 [Russula vinacea]|nr:hypothetical protein BJV77DRAFT_981006 [Russula vinacea]